MIVRMTPIVGYYSIWPFFACIGLLLALAATPLFAAADASPSSRSGPHQKRLLAMDGLRGFLALAVLFHHAAIYHGYLRDGLWEAPAASPFYSLLGQAGVAMFFMVTGHLFWSRMIDEAGRPSWVRLYIGRLFRIGPLYLVAIGGMLVIVALGTQLHLAVPGGQLLSQILGWLALGVIIGPNVNGYPGTELILAGVTWTLRYEWLFYACLPIAAIATRRRQTHLPFSLAGLIGCSIALSAYSGPPGDALTLVCVTMFLTGMACASLQRSLPRLPLSDNAASGLVLVVLVATFALFSTAFSVAPIILLGVVFYLVTAGCTVFGVLTSRPARRLGNVSYGIYLLQGLALAVVLRPGPLRALSLADPAYHWALVLLCAVLLTVLATIMHVLIERPGIRAGQKVIDLVAGPNRRTRVSSGG